MMHDVPPGCRRNLSDQRQCLGVAACLELRQQPRQGGRVVVGDCIGDQAACALVVTDLDFDVSAPGHLLLSADLCDGRAQLVVGLDASLRAVHVTFQLRISLSNSKMGFEV